MYILVEKWIIKKVSNWKFQIVFWGWKWGVWWVLVVHRIFTNQHIKISYNYQFFALKLINWNIFCTNGEKLIKKCSKKCQGTSNFIYNLKLKFRCLHERKSLINIFLFRLLWVFFTTQDHLWFSIHSENNWLDWYLHSHCSCMSGRQTLGL